MQMLDYDFSVRLRMHVTSLHHFSLVRSSDDDTALSSNSNDDFSTILLSPGFQPASAPLHCKMLVPLSSPCWTTDVGAAHTITHMAGVFASYLF